MNSGANTSMSTQSPSGRTPSGPNVEDEWIVFDSETRPYFDPSKSVGIFTGNESMAWTTKIKFAKIGYVGLVAPFEICRSKHVKEAVERCGEHLSVGRSKEELDKAWNSTTNDAAEQIGAETARIRRVIKTHFGEDIQFWDMNEPAACSLLSNGVNTILTTAPRLDRQASSAYTVTSQLLGLTTLPATANVVYVCPDQPRGRQR
jgi:hypothetical protein